MDARALALPFVPDRGGTGLGLEGARVLRFVNM
jgi:hypothetical protein